MDEEKIVVLQKCKRCKIKASADDICDFCINELNALKRKSFDHYFWGLDVSRNDESIYFIRIYHNCDDLHWLVGRSVQIDLNDGQKKVCGVIKKAECMQTPPYKSGDVISIMIE